MDLAIIILGVLYLCGVKVGTPLAICAIIEGLLIIISTIIKKLDEWGLDKQALLCYNWFIKGKELILWIKKVMRI